MRTKLPAILAISSLVVGFPSISAKESKLPTPADSPFVEAFRIPDVVVGRHDPFAPEGPPRPRKGDLYSSTGVGVDAWSSTRARILDFRLSTAGRPSAKRWETRENLLLVFARLNEILRKRHKEKIPMTTFSVTQRTGEGKYLAKIHGCLWGPDDLYVRVGDNVLLTQVKASLADGERLEIPAKLTGDIYEYDSVEGSNKRVRVVQNQTGKTTEFVPLTQTTFVELVKKGTPVGVVLESEEECSGCFGDGELTALQEHAKCPDCNGDGDVKLKTFYNVIWK